MTVDTMTSKKHEVPEELLAKLLADHKKPEDLIGENGLLKQLTKLLVEKALDADLTEHLGHERNETVTNSGGNTRNGKSRKPPQGRVRRAAYRGPPRSPRQLRAPTHPQASDPLERLRRQDHLAVRPGHDRA